MMKKKFKRKKINLSIKKKMQTRLILKVFLIVVLSVGVSSAIFYFYSQREIGSSLHVFHVKANNFLDFLLPAIILSLVVSLALGFIVSLFYPGNIAGPLYRIEREILIINEGDLTRNIILRKGDEMEDLAGNINIMVKGLREKIERIKKFSLDIKMELLKKEEGKLETAKLEALSLRLEEIADCFKIK